MEKLIRRPFKGEIDFWRSRNFLREIFLLNGRLERSWNVARLDYLRWHLMATCDLIPPLEQVSFLWESEHGEIAALLHPICHDEVRLHIHPAFRTAALEEEIVSYAEEHLSDKGPDSDHILYVPVFTDDALRKEVLAGRGFKQRSGWGHHYRRDLDQKIPAVVVPEGYLIRSMGLEEEYSARGWCSWTAFHHDEPVSNYDGDASWYCNMQSAPLYRRDLDIVAATPSGEIAAFVTIFFDDYTRSAVTVVVGTGAAHWRRGLGKAVICEGMHRLQRLGCTRVFSSAHNDAPADALYRSVMTDRMDTETWTKEW